MSQGGDTAELMVRESIEITEAAVKLAAMGMKNLAALVLALAKDEHKVAGLTNAIKSPAIGWDDRWGTLQKVWAEGSSTTGKWIPFGLDCTGCATRF